MLANRFDDRPDVFGGIGAFSLRLIKGKLVIWKAQVATERRPRGIGPQTGQLF